MSRWFRFYADAMRNPKVAALTDKDFRLWVRMLSVAAENDGLIPPVAALKHMLSMRIDHLLTGVERLSKAGLIDELADGYEPHNWGKFQYKSDTSTARVTLHRERRNVAGNVSVTPPETDTEQKVLKDKPLIPTRVPRSPAFCPPDWVPAEPWRGFLEMRAKIGKPMTDNAKRLLLVKLARISADAGQPPGDILDQSTMNSWTTIYALKVTANDRDMGRNHGPGLPPVGNVRTQAALALREQFGTRATRN